MDTACRIIPFPRKFDEKGKAWEPWVRDTTIARHFGVQPRTVRRWQQLGMPSRKVEGSRRYRLSECDRWLADRATRR